jgi:hypothetical protein
VIWKLPFQRAASSLLLWTYSHWTGFNPPSRDWPIEAAAAEARRLVERFEWHYTPKHGSWLDLAESELGILSSQCLDRRIPDKQTLIDEIAAWEHDRNANHTKANWRFTTPNARIKLKHLRPSI